MESLAIKFKIELLTIFLLNLKCTLKSLCAISLDGALVC